jgi:putative sterol carrier protein
MALDVVGHVREGDDVVHVVYRGTTSVGNVKISKMSVMSLKADGESWRMLLTGDIEGMAAMMKLQFGARE